MATRLESYLVEHPEGIRLEDIAEEVLGISGPRELVRRLAAQALRDAGARPSPDGRWRLLPADEESFVALLVRSTGTYPPHDAILEIGAARIAGDEIKGAFSSHVLPDRLLAPDAVTAAGVSPADLAGGIPLDSALDRVAPLVLGARPVTYTNDHSAAILGRALRSKGHDGRLGEPIVLGPALRRAGIIPPRGDLLKAAASLRVVVPETGDAGTLARTTANVFLAAVARGIDLEGRGPVRRFDFGRTAFGPELIETLPEHPGIYRFFDQHGSLLYVGKARNLKARVTTYFGHRARRRRMHAELVRRLYRLEWEETGSELGALLKEINEIREKAPPLNVQRGVRRRRATGGDLVLFLPGEAEGEVMLLLVREGAPAGRVGSDRRARGMREVRAALKSVYFSTGAPPPGDPDDAEILASWLRLEGDRQNYLDLSETGGIQDAARKVKEFLTDPDLFEGKIFRR